MLSLGSRFFWEGWSMNGKLAKVRAFGLDEEWRPRDSRAAAGGFNDVTGTSGDDVIVLRKVS
jgi:hypothetical protein